MSIAEIFRGYRFHFNTEADLQDQVASVLDGGFIEYEREVSLSKKDRIDFLAKSGVGIEVKIGSPTTEVIRQLFRYSESERVDSLILLTNKARHLSIASSMSGKPVSIVLVGGFV